MTLLSAYGISIGSVPSNQSHSATQVRTHRKIEISQFSINFRPVVNCCQLSLKTGNN